MMRSRDASAPASKKEHQRCQDTNMTSVDPVCAMTVDPNHAAGQDAYKGQTYYFCSTHCLHKFREDPELYLNKTAGQTVQPLQISSLRKPAAAAPEASSTGE